MAGSLKPPCFSGETGPSCVDYSWGGGRDSPHQTLDFSHVRLLLSTRLGGDGDPVFVSVHDLLAMLRSVCMRNVTPSNALRRKTP